MEEGLTLTLSSIGALTLLLAVVGALLSLFLGDRDVRTRTERELHRAEQEAAYWRHKLEDKETGW